MSKRKRPTKPPSERRRETPESKAFRREMKRDEISPQDRRMLAELIERWVKAGVIAEPGDHETISRLCQFNGWMEVNGEPLPKVWPLIDVDEHAEFDSALCKAGLKKFVRPGHISDDPIRTKCVLVQELSPGIRARVGLTEAVP